MLTNRQLQKGPESKIVERSKDSVTQLEQWVDTVCSKGHLISKANYGLPTSSKKRTDEYDLFAFLLFTENKSNQIRSFFGRS